jgi:hypothetical protein
VAFAMSGRGPLHLASWHCPVTTQPVCLLGQVATGVPSVLRAHAPLQLEPTAMSLQVDGQVLPGRAGGAPSHTAATETGCKATKGCVSSRISQGTSMQAHAAASSLKVKASGVWSCSQHVCWRSPELVHSRSSPPHLLLTLQPEAVHVAVAVAGTPTD